MNDMTDNQINNTLLSGLIVIQALAQKEIELCENKEDLVRIEKGWKKYFAEMNKYLAGKSDAPPELPNIGKLSYE